MIHCCGRLPVSCKWVSSQSFVTSVPSFTQPGWQIQPQVTIPVGGEEQTTRSASSKLQISLVVVCKIASRSRSSRRIDRLLELSAFLIRIHTEQSPSLFCCCEWLDSVTEAGPTAQPLPCLEKIPAIAPTFQCSSVWLNGILIWMIATTRATIVVTANCWVEDWTAIAPSAFIGSRWSFAIEHHLDRHNVAVEKVTPVDFRILKYSFSFHYIWVSLWLCRYALAIPAHIGNELLINAEKSHV